MNDGALKLLNLWIEQWKTRIAFQSIYGLNEGGLKLCKIWIERWYYNPGHVTLGPPVAKRLFLPSFLFPFSLYKCTPYSASNECSLCVHILKFCTANSFTLDYFERIFRLNNFFLGPAPEAPGPRSMLALSLRGLCSSWGKPH